MSIREWRLYGRITTVHGRDTNKHSLQNGKRQSDVSLIKIYNFHRTLGADCALYTSFGMYLWPSVWYKDSIYMQISNTTIDELVSGLLLLFRCVLKYNNCRLCALTHSLIRFSTQQKRLMINVY